MKFIRLLLPALMVLCSSCYAGRFFYYNFADTGDYKKFPVHQVAGGNTAFHFTPAVNKKNDSSIIRLPSGITVKDKNYTLEQYSKKRQTEKAFCCLNAIARDYATFGRQWWHNPTAGNRSPDFYAHGIPGQYIYDPGSGLIILRPGKKEKIQTGLTLLLKVAEAQRKNAS